MAVTPRPPIVRRPMAPRPVVQRPIPQRPTSQEAKETAKSPETKDEVQPQITQPSNRPAPSARPIVPRPATARPLIQRPLVPRPVVTQRPTTSSSPVSETDKAPVSRVRGNIVSRPTSTTRPQSPAVPARPSSSSGTRRTGFATNVPTQDAGKPEPKKKGRRNTSFGFETSNVSDIRGIDEQDDRNSGMADEDRAAYNTRRQSNGCPFVPDPPDFLPDLDWKAIGGIPGGVKEPFDYKNVKPEDVNWDFNNYGHFITYEEEPALPDTPPPLPENGYLALQNWIISLIPPEEQEGACYPDSLEMKLALDMFMGRRPDIYWRYEDAGFKKECVKKAGVAMEP